MKKILFILIILLLGGCTGSMTRINQQAIVILHIDSSIDPEIDYSRGIGIYDANKKQFQLTVQTIAPVDIGLTYPGYLSKTISISSEELLSGLVEKIITFKETKKTNISLRIITESPLDEVEVLGLDFIQEEDYFTCILPNRNQFITIRIKAGIGYQEKTIQLTPDDLITGLVKKEIILPKINQVVLSTDKTNQYLLNVRTVHDNEQIIGIPAQGKINYIVEKDQELYYFNYFSRETKYLKMTEDFHLPFIDDGRHYRSYSISSNAPSYIKNNLYYELNNRIYPAPISVEGINIQTINLSIYAKLFFISEENHKIYFHYHKGFEYGKPTISITEDDFLDPVLHQLQIRYFDVVRETYLEEISVQGVDYQANENQLFTEFELYPEQIDQYIMANEIDPITSIHKIGEEWHSEIFLFPEAEGIIIHLVDQNNQPIDAHIDNVNYQKEGDAYLLTNLFFNELGMYESQLLNIDYQEQYYYVSFVLFAQMLEVIQIEDKVYLEYMQPIALDID